MAATIARPSFSLQEVLVSAFASFSIKSYDPYPWRASRNCRSSMMNA
jgi:hypothetical protein